MSSRKRGRSDLASKSEHSSQAVKNQRTDACNDTAQSAGIQPILSEDYECAICQDVIIDPVVGTCGHDYCKRCLTRWLSTSNQCPQCRKRLPVDFGVCLRLRTLVETLFPKQVAQRRQELADEDQAKVRISTSDDRPDRARRVQFWDRVVPLIPLRNNLATFGPSHVSFPSLPQHSWQSPATDGVFRHHCITAWLAVLLRTQGEHSPNHDPSNYVDLYRCAQQLEAYWYQNAPSRADYSDVSQLEQVLRRYNDQQNHGFAILGSVTPAWPRPMQVASAVGHAVPVSRESVQPTMQPFDLWSPSPLRSPVRVPASVAVPTAQPQHRAGPALSTPAFAPPAFSIGITTHQAVHAHSVPHPVAPPPPPVNPISTMQGAPSRFAVPPAVAAPMVQLVPISSLPSTPSISLFHDLVQLDTGARRVAPILPTTDAHAARVPSQSVRAADPAPVPLSLGQEDMAYLFALFADSPTGPLTVDTHSPRVAPGPLHSSGLQNILGAPRTPHITPPAHPAYTQPLLPRHEITTGAGGGLAGHALRPGLPQPAPSTAPDLPRRQVTTAPVHQPAAYGLPFDTQRHHHPHLHIYEEPLFRQQGLRRAPSWESWPGEASAYELERDSALPSDNSEAEADSLEGSVFVAGDRTPALQRHRDVVDLTRD